MTASPTERRRRPHGHPADYDGWAKDGCDGWSYREVLPCFPNYRAEPNDRATAFRGLRLAREMMRQDAQKPFVAREALPGPGVDGEAALFRGNSA